MIVCKLEYCLCDLPSLPSAVKSTIGFLFCSMKSLARWMSWQYIQWWWKSSTPLSICTSSFISCPYLMIQPPPLLAWHIFLIVASPTPPNVAQVSIHGPSASMSSPRSPSHNNNDFPIPSLYLLSTVNVALAVDYSKDVRLADGVVDTPPPPRLLATPTFHSLHNEKCVSVIGVDTSLSIDSQVLKIKQAHLNGPTPFRCPCCFQCPYSFPKPRRPYQCPNCATLLVFIVGFLHIDPPQDKGWQSYP